MSHSVLIIDDNKKQRSKIEEILGGTGTVLATDSVDKAFDIVRYTEVAVILIDFSLEGTTIKKFMERLQEDVNTQDTFVIAIVDDKHSAQEALQSYQSGVVDYIEKPFQADMVRSMVKVFIKLYHKSKRVKHLLNNILPVEIAHELETFGKVKPKRYNLATVLFTDFVGFSYHTKNMRPVELIAILDTYFAGFDKACKKYQVEKIKTIGDAYMAVAGVPEKRKENPVLAVLAAFEINQFMMHLNRRNAGLKRKKKNWQLKIGLHSGPLVAGVIGKSKFAYDIWGNSVNVASRICSSAEPGRVNVSASTYEHIKDYFDCTYRGELEAKNIGLMGMYHVDKIKSKYALTEDGTKPNKELLQAAGLIFVQYPRLFNYITGRLTEELPKDLHYHGVHHTLDVINSVQKIVRHENLNDDEHLLLNTAALLHDAGYIFTYHHNEELAVKMAKKILPDYGYTPNQINIISGIIRTTKVRSKPKTQLQMIMNDADYDYLGRKDYFKVASTLYKELLAQGAKISKTDWVKMQIRFLEKHVYYTDYSQKFRQRQKLANMAKLIRSLSKM